MYGVIYDPGVGNYHPRMRLDLDVVPRDNSRRALAPSVPAISAISQWGWISTPCGVSSIREMSVSVLE